MSISTRSLQARRYLALREKRRRRFQMPAKPSKPAPEVKAPAGEIKKEDAKVIPPASNAAKLPAPAKQDAPKLAKDLGAEKFLGKCLISLKEVASQEDIT